MENLPANITVPPLVRQALAIAERLQFPFSCTPHTGQFLRLLASHIDHGIIGETGTGCGVGAAWLLSGLPATSTLVTVERDDRRATAVRLLFAHDARVRTLHADWRELLAFGPFDLLFLDGGGRLKAHVEEAGAVSPSEDDVALVLGALRVGGLLLLDDLTPVTDWPLEWRGKPDLTRAYWLHDPRVLAQELIVNPQGGPASSVILASRVR